MFVWNAMPSITPVISDTLFELLLIWPMVCTMPSTASLPASAMPEARVASSLARRALSVFCFTVSVNLSHAGRRFFSELACCSVRDDRSKLPAAISPDAVAMPSVPILTCPTSFDRLWFMAFRLSIN